MEYLLFPLSWTGSLSRSCIYRALCGGKRKVKHSLDPCVTRIILLSQACASALFAVKKGKWSFCGGKNEIEALM